MAAVDCAKEAIQSENTVKAAGLLSVTCKYYCVGQLCQRIGCPHIVGDGLDLCLSHGGGHPHMVNLVLAQYHAPNQKYQSSMNDIVESE